MRWLHIFRSLRSGIIQAPRPVSGLVLGAGSALLVHVLLTFGWLDGLNRGSLDALFRMRGERYGAKEVVLVITNDETVARYNYWPIPRRVYAQVVRRLHQAGAKTVVFDLLFSERSLLPNDDAELIRACREAGNVIQGSAFHVEGLYNPALPVSATGLEGKLDSRFALRDRTKGVDNHFRSGVWVSASLPALRETSPLLGHLNVHPQRDGTLRRIPHAIRYRSDLYPSLALAAAAHYYQIPPRDIEVAPDVIRIAGRRLPIEANGETGINWAGGNGTFSTYTVSQVLDGDVPDEAFRGKIVLIGTTAAGSFEYRSTPFSSIQPALEVQANALDNILLNRPLHTTGGWISFLLLFVFTVTAGALIAPRLDLGGTFLLLSVTGVLWLLALWLIKHHNLFLPVAPPMLAAALTYALAMAINYRQQWEANYRSDAAVAALARGGALMATGRNRNRLESVIRKTARDTLRAQEILLLRPNAADSLTAALMQQLSTRRRAVFHPFRRRASATEQPFAPDEELRGLLDAFARRAGESDDKLGARPSIVAAPIVQAEATKPETGARPPRVVGALVAVGAQATRCFGVRDAILLETLAEQAGMALGNLEFYELLQGRVELANRDLREAYGVLAEQSAKFMAAVESMHDALVICDAQGQAIFTNGGAEPTLREATPDLGENVAEVLHAHDLHTIAALFDCFELHAQNPSASAEAARCEAEIADDNLENGGRMRVLSAQLTPLYADGGEPIGAMLLVADITAQRELDQMKTDFVSFVAHELRSPLGAILGYASLLQQYSDQATPEMRAEMTESIVRQCHRLNRLVGDLLDISRLDAGRPLDLRRERVELRTVAEKVLDAQRAALGSEKIKFQLLCNEAALSVWGDPDRIEQILVNLVSNAVKYSPDGGEVRVCLEEKRGEGGEGVALSVADPGLGMSREQIENLFQKYYRTPDARLRGIKGTGLGLYLVKNLVEAHNGKIEVHSEIGKGTTFTVWLPQYASESSVTPFLEHAVSASPVETGARVR